MHSIRRATVADYASFVRLAPELGSGWPIPSEREWRENLAPQAWIAEVDGAVAGYLVGALADPRAQVHQLVVDPAHRRTGLGQRLLRAFAATAREAGKTAWQLNVEGPNAAARSLYERMGLCAEMRSDWIASDGGTVASLPRDPSLRGRDLQPGDDEALEQVFGIGPRAMRWYRDVGRPLVALDAAGTPVGFGVWLQHKAAVRPLLLRRVDVLPALLAPLVHEGPLTLVVEEGIPGLREALLAAGGRVTLEEFRYAGTIER